MSKSDNVLPFVRPAPAEPAAEPTPENVTTLIIKQLRAIADGIERGILPALHAVLVMQDEGGVTMTAYLTPQDTPAWLVAGMLSDAIGATVADLASNHT
jgi:hypothetical protein